MIAIESRDSRRGFLKKILGGTLACCAGRCLAASLRDLGTGNASADPEDEDFWKLVRTQFPLTDERIYFNTGGLGPSPRCVIDAYLEANRRLERICETGHSEVKKVRAATADFLGCDADEIALTRNTTEGMNLIARGLPLRAGDEVLLSTHEHPGGAIPWLALAKDKKIKVRLFEPGESAARNLEIIAAQLSKRTRVLSLSHITCTNGLVFPVKKISQVCRDREVIIVYDGAHPPGMMPVDLSDIDCDFYAASGHKWLLGPKGTGFLYIKRDMLDVWKPTYVGAYSDSNYDLDALELEYKREANIVEYGTRNTPLLLAFGAALHFLSTISMERIAARGKYLADTLRGGLSRCAYIELLTPREPQSCASITTFRPLRKKHTELIGELSAAGFRTRIVNEHKLDGIRVSTHIYTSFEEVQRFIETVQRLA